VPTVDSRLTAMATAAGREHGLQRVDGFFVFSKEFGFRWTQQGRQLDLLVSDYLQDAPDAALSDFVTGTVGYICSKQSRFGPAYLAYVTSDTYILAKRPVYLRRSRNLTCTDQGVTRNLCDAAQRIMDLGLIGPHDLDNAFLSWTAAPTFRRLGYCSTMMRVVAISSAFDNENVPEYALDYVVYHECLHLRQGYRPFVHRHHDAEFRRQEHLFPEWRTAENILKSLARY